MLLPDEGRAAFSEVEGEETAFPAGRDVELIDDGREGEVPEELLPEGRTVPELPPLLPELPEDVGRGVPECMVADGR